MTRRSLRQGGGEIWCALACAVVGGLVGLVPWLIDGRAYFRDDAETQYIPTFAAIGRSLLQGALPLFTVQSYVGGNLVGEYQFALFNPVSLLADMVLASIGDMAQGAAALAIFYFAVLCAGTFVLGRACGIRRPIAVAVAATFATNNFVYYWLATSWFSNFVALAWLVWALAFLFTAHRSRLRWLLAAVLSALTVAAGSYYVDVVLGAAIGLTAVAWLIAGSWRRAAVTLLAGAAALLLTAPAWLPLLATMPIAERPAATFNHGFLVPDLYGVLSLSSPLRLGLINGFLDDRYVRTPIFFAAWFLLPVLAFVQWRKLRWRWPLPVVAALAAVTLLGTQGPEQWSAIRWPVRFLPYFHLAVLLLAGAALGSGRLEGGWRRTGLALGLVALGALSALQAQPATWELVLAATALMAVCTLALGRLVRSGPGLVALLLIPGALFFGATRLLIPDNPNLPSFASSGRIGPTLSLGAVPDSYTMYVRSERGAASTSGEDLIGQLPLVRGVATVTGYSPIGFHALAEELCITNRYACPDHVRRLLRTDPDTGRPIADLMRIGRIIVEKGAYLEQSAASLAGDWRHAGDGRNVAYFERAKPAAWGSGSVSWVSPGLELQAAKTASATEESYVVARRAGQNDRVVFARLAWPGYEAELGGRPLPLRRHLGFLVAVDLPDGDQAGELVLRWRPPLRTLGTAAAGCGLLIGLVVVLCWPLVAGIRRREGARAT